MKYKELQDNLKLHVKIRASLTELVNHSLASITNNAEIKEKINSLENEIKENTNKLLECIELREVFIKTLNIPNKKEPSKFNIEEFYMEGELEHIHYTIEEYEKAGLDYFNIDDGDIDIVDIKPTYQEEKKERLS